MSLFDKFSSLPDRYARIVTAGRDPFGVRMDGIKSATEVVIDGRDVILAGSNNYLGLTFDDACIEAGRQALLDQGTGTTGSRIANGTYHGHQQLERSLAELMDCSTAIVFPSGYQANLGMISTLAAQGDYIFIDADCHACIYDGCLMTGATIVRFRHNSPEDLDRRLGQVENKNANKLIIVEGLYSMFGDTAPLEAIAEVKRKHNAYLYIDEAHSLGVYGENGRGLAEHAGILKDADFLVGTFSKSLGAIGGFCASNHQELELVRFASRPYMFTASISPSTVATVITAIKQIRTRPQLRESLWANAHRLHQGLNDLGLKLCAPPSPIVTVEMPDQDSAVACWNQLLDSDVYVNLAIPPGTPNSKSLLRSSISASHTPHQIDKIIEAFESVARYLGVYPPARAGVAAEHGQRVHAEPESAPV